MEKVAEKDGKIRRRMKMPRKGVFGKAPIANSKNGQRVRRTRKKCLIH